MSAVRATWIIMFAAFAAASNATAFAAEAASAAGVSAAKAAWTLTTDDTKLTVGVGQDQQLYVYELSNSAAGWNWTAQPAVFSLLNRVAIDGKQHSLHWEYKDGNVDSADGKKVTICFINREPALELKSVWHARPGRGPVRHTMFLTNKTGGTITIYEQETFALRVVGPDGGVEASYISDDQLIPDAVGVYRDRLTKDYQKTLTINSHSQDWIPYVVVSASDRCGVYVGWEWSNGRLAIAGDATGNGASLKVGIDDRFRTDLSAGETFAVPPGFVGAYAGDLDDAGNSVRRYLFNYNMPELIRKDATFPKVEWNAFAPTGKAPGSWDPTEKKYYPFIDDIAPLGFEEVVIDVGWWSSYGDPGHIVTDAADWPKGMAAAAAYAHQHGIRFGLYDNEPEMFTDEAGKRERISDITFLLKDLHADFYRSDSTAAPVIQGKAGPDQRAHYPEDVSYWATQGFYEVLDTLYRQIPTFLWENCACGGAMKDFGALRRCSRIQNQDRYYPIDARHAFYDSSHVLPPTQISTLVGSWDEWQASGSVYEFRSASLGAAVWHPDAPNGGNGGPIWSPQQKEQIRRAVATYKERIRPLIRNGDVYHIFPRPNGLQWDGIEYFDPAAKRGVVYIFKPAEQNGNEMMKIMLRGVRPDAQYRVTFEDGTNPACQKSGAELRAGIEVRLRGIVMSELMFFEEIAQAKP